MRWNARSRFAWLCAVAMMVFAVAGCHPGYVVWAQPLAASDAAGTWAGMSNSDRFVRLDLDENGTGRIIVGDDVKPDQLRSASVTWTLSSLAIHGSLTSSDPNFKFTHLDGEPSRRGTMKIRLEDHALEAVLFRPEQFNQRLQATNLESPSH